jgi:hypothetical protein
MSAGLLGRAFLKPRPMCVVDYLCSPNRLGGSRFRGPGWRVIVALSCQAVIRNCVEFVMTMQCRAGTSQPHESQVVACTRPDREEVGLPAR